MSLPDGLLGSSRIEMVLQHRAGGPWQLGRYHYSRAHPGLPVHSHQDAYEICFLVRGRQTYRVGRQVCCLTGGDVLVTRPDEKHSTGGLPEEKGILYWMILPVPREGEDFLGLVPAQAAPYLDGLKRIRRRHFRGFWKMKEHLDAITMLYHQPQNPLRSCAILNHAAAFLLEVLAAASAKDPAGSASSLQPVLRYIEDHREDALTVPRLAAVSGLSVPRFKARFKQELGIPPGEYVLRSKIEEARRRLAQRECSITQTAFDLGFSSSQYFATVFKRFIGSTPTEFREAIRNDEKVRR